MHNLKEIKIWHKAIDLAADVYRVTADLPKEERYGLTSQLRRSAVSVSSNIAEGAGRNTNGEFVHFLGVANGSAYELQTQLILAVKLSLLQEKNIKPLLSELDSLQKMIYRFQETLRRK